MSASAPKGNSGKRSFSRDAARELEHSRRSLSTDGGCKPKQSAQEDARELEPALSPETRKLAVLRPDEASVDNRCLTHAVLEAGAEKWRRDFTPTGKCKAFGEKSSAALGYC